MKKKKDEMITTQRKARSYTMNRNLSTMATIKLEGQEQIDSSKCTVCSQKVANQQVCEVGVQTNAADAAVFDCYWCKYSTNDLDALKEHLRIHIDEPHAETCKDELRAETFKDELHAELLDDQPYAEALEVKKMEPIIDEAKESEQMIDDADDFEEKHFDDQNTSIDSFDENSVEKVLVKKRRVTVQPNRKKSSKKYASKSYYQPAIKGTYKCTFCYKIYKFERVFKKHLRIHEVGKPVFTCYLCNQDFDQKFKLKRHMPTHVGKLHLCDICGLKFMRRERLLIHRRDHGGEPIKCHICLLQFSVRSTLQEHLRTQHAKEPCFLCETCNDTSFFNQHDLTKHILKAHPEKMSAVCHICKKHFQNKNYLAYHIRNVHTNTQRIECPHCPYKCSTKFRMTIHIRTHTGERPFGCDLCDQRFVRKTFLNEHMRKHTGDKPFKCEQCPKAFINRQYLQQHIRTHTGEKPYGCKICGQKFAVRSNMRSHELNVHLKKGQRTD